jgi:hypothetical protein
MYDSEEVRGAVRRDALVVFMHRTGAFQGFADLPPLDLLVINEAVTAEGNPWQRALREYLEERAVRSRVNMLEQIAEAIMTWLRPLMEEALEVMRSFFFQVGEVVDAARRAMAELAEAAGLLEKPEPEPFVWQRRSRRPQVQVVHAVDAVAAGRSPSAWFRTRVRGGRR